MHALYHLIVEPLGAALERFDQPPCAVEFGFARGEGAVARLDLARVNQAFAVEAEPPALLGFALERVEIVELVVHAVEHCGVGGARGEDDQLQRRRKCRPTGVER